MKKFKLSWVEQNTFEVTIEAKSQKEAEKKFFDWDEEIWKCCKEVDASGYVENTLVIDEVEN